MSKHRNYENFSNTCQYRVFTDIEDDKVKDIGVVDPEGNEVVNGYAYYTIYDTFIKLTSSDSTRSGIVFENNGKKLFEFSETKIFAKRGTKFLYIFLKADELKTWFSITIDETLINLHCDHIDIPHSIITNEYLMIRKNKKCGLFDLNSQSVVVEPIYDDISKDVMYNRYILDNCSKLSFFDIESNVIIDTKYSKYYRVETNSFCDNEHLKNTNFVSVEVDGKVGIINGITFDEVIPCLYDKIEYTRLGDHEYFILSFNKKYKLYSLNDQKLYDYEYDLLKVALDMKDYILVKNNEKYGLINYSGELIIPILYDNIELLRGDKYVMVKGNEKYGIVSIKNEPIIPIYYSKISDIGYGKVIANNEEKKIIFNLHGEKLMECDNITKLYESIYSVKVDGKYGTISTATMDAVEVLIEPKYNMIKNVIRSFNNDSYVTISIDGKTRWGIISDGKERVEPKYDKILASEDCRYIVNIGTKWGVLGDDYEERIPIKHPQIVDTVTLNNYEVAIVVSQLSLQGVILTDKQYKEVEDVIVPIKYNKCILIDDINRDIFAVQSITKKWGFINIDKKKIACHYFDFKLIENCICVSSANDKWGVIDNNLDIILPVNYDDVVELCDHDYRCYGIAVKKNKKYGIFNLNGEMKLPIEYDEICDYDDYISIVKNGKYGLLDTNLNMVVKPDKFDHLKPIGKGRVITKLNGLKGMLLDGEEICEPKYYDISNNGSGFDVTTYGEYKTINNINEL